MGAVKGKVREEMKQSQHPHSLSSKAALWYPSWQGAHNQVKAQTLQSEKHEQRPVSQSEVRGI